jgi:hypothetical protein
MGDIKILELGTALPCPFSSTPPALVNHPHERTAASHVLARFERERLNGLAGQEKRMSLSQEGFLPFDFIKRFREVC